MIELVAKIISLLIEIVGLATAILAYKLIKEKKGDE